MVTVLANTSERRIALTRFGCLRCLLFRREHRKTDSLTAFAAALLARLAAGLRALLLDLLTGLDRECHDDFLCLS